MFLSAKTALQRGVVRAGLLRATIRTVKPIPTLHPSSSMSSVYSPFSTSMRLFSTTGINTTEIQPPILPPVDKNKVKQLKTAEICLYLKAKKRRGYDIFPLVFELAERDDVFADEIELGVRSLYKMRRYASINKFLQTITLKHERVYLTVSTIEMMFESIISEKNYALTDLLWATCSPRDRHHWNVIALYTRALLGNHRLTEASPFLSTIKKKSFRIRKANAAVLMGLTEGGYNAECLSFYLDLEKIDPKLKLLTDPRGYFSPIISAYRLQNYPAVLSIFSQVEQRELAPCREVVYAITEIYANGDFWKPEYARRMGEAKEHGIEFTEELELALLARSRLDQFLKGAAVMGKFCKHNKEAEVVKNRKGNLSVRVHTYEGNQRKMRLIAALVDVGEEAEEPGDRVLVVRTAENDSIARDLLEKELYPSIEFVDKGEYLIMKVCDVKKWFEKKDVDLELF